MKSYRKKREMRNVDMQIYRGDIYYVVKTDFQSGSEQKSGRPAVVVSNNVNNEHSPTVEVVYCTTREKNDLPTHVKITSTPQMSTVLCKQVTTIDKELLGDKIGRCSTPEIKQIDDAICVSLGINQASLAERLINPSQDYQNESGSVTAPLGEYNPELLAANVEKNTYKLMYESLLDRLSAILTR